MHSHKMDRAITVHDMGRGVSPVSLALGAALAMGLAYAVVLAQPNLVHGLRSVFGSFPGASSAPWALPVAAAGIAVAGGALGVIVLSTVARMAQRNPFLWLGPVLVAFTMIVLAGVSAKLPWPSLPLPAFAAISGLALLGGGAVLQMPGRAGRVAGALMIALPLSSLIAGYAAIPAGMTVAAHGGSQGGALVLVIIALTSVGIAATALIARAEDLEAVARMRQTFEYQRLQLIDALEVGRMSEARVRDAERRMELLEHGIAPAATDDVAALRAMKGESGNALQWALGASLVMLCVACGALYFGLYQPTARKLHAQSAELAQIAGAHAAELSALRADFDAQKSSLTALLETARSGIAAAAPAPQEAQGKLTEQPPPAAAAAPAVEPAAAKPAADKPAAVEPAAVEPAATKPAAPEPKAQKHKVVRARHKPVAHKPAAKAVPAPREAPAAAATSRPGVPELDAKTSRALRESEARGDDDPLSGL